MMFLRWMAGCSYYGLVGLFTGVAVGPLFGYLLLGWAAGWHELARPLALRGEAPLMIRVGSPLGAGAGLVAGGVAAGLERRLGRALDRWFAWSVGGVTAGLVAWSLGGWAAVMLTHRDIRPLPSCIYGLVSAWLAAYLSSPSPPARGIKTLARLGDQARSELTDVPYWSRAAGAGVVVILSILLVRLVIATAPK